MAGAWGSDYRACLWRSVWRCVVAEGVSAGLPRLLCLLSWAGAPCWVLSPHIPSLL